MNLKGHKLDPRKLQVPRPAFLKKAKPKKTGLPPGSLVYTGDRLLDQQEITTLTYNKEELAQKQGLPDEIELRDDHMLWIDIRGLHEVDPIERVCSRFSIHKLAQEDILDVYQRPKFEEYDNGIFMVVRTHGLNPDTLQIRNEHIAIFAGNGFLISFQETSSDEFSHVRNRIEQSSGLIRQRKSDYLAYALIDSVVDHYFIMLDQLSDETDALENEIQESPRGDIKRRMQLLRRGTIELRRSFAPLREAIHRFLRSESPMLEERTGNFLRDLYDHILQLYEINESIRETLSALNDLYISEISFRMNKVMQTLTIIATIFIPLTFIAGIYGMNFEHMPELGWKYGYPAVWTVMLAITLVLLYFFRKRNWF